MARPGRISVCARDEDNPYDVFEFTTSRSDGPAAFLKDFTGTHMADGYGRYDSDRSQPTHLDLCRMRCGREAPDPS